MREPGDHRLDRRRPRLGAPRQSTHCALPARTRRIWRTSTAGSVPRLRHAGERLHAVDAGTPSVRRTTLPGGSVGGSSSGAAGPARAAPAGASGAGSGAASVGAARVSAGQRLAAGPLLVDGRAGRRPTRDGRRHRPRRTAGTARVPRPASCRRTRARPGEVMSRSAVSEPADHRRREHAVRLGRRRGHAGGRSAAQGSRRSSSSPLVTWEPALGATTYEIQLSRQLVPVEGACGRRPRSSTRSCCRSTQATSARGTTASAASTRPCRRAAQAMSLVGTRSRSASPATASVVVK